jgi:dTDP-4-amino-4,6-dideoxygalactose transaminase
MLARIRPYFNSSYIQAIDQLDPETPREEYSREISKKLMKYYPNAKGIEFIDLGRHSLKLALNILNIKENDEVILSSFNFPPILEPIIEEKVKPILVDVDFDFGMEIDHIADNISSKTKAVLVTHFWGIPSNILEIKEVASEHGLYIIEDCAHTFCSEVDGLKLGSIGDVAFTSFRNDKPLSLGRGSALIVNNGELSGQIEHETSNLSLNPLIDEKSSFLSMLSFYLNTESSRYNRFIGIDDDYGYFKYNASEVDRILQSLSKDDKSLAYSINKLHNNYKFKLFKIFQAVRPMEIATTRPALMNIFSLNLLNFAIRYIDELNSIRKGNGIIYNNNLRSNEDIIAPIDLQNVPFLRYPIICKRVGLKRRLKERLMHGGFEADNFNWETPLNKILNINNKYKKSEHISKNIINLPSHPYLKVEDISNICNIINN